MFRRSLLPLLIILLIAVSSCKNNSATKTVAPALNKEWYKRYTGTIAGQPVVVNLYCHGDNSAWGTYYYSGKSELLYLSLSADTVNAGHIRVTESVMTERHLDDEVSSDEDSEFANVWDITIDGEQVKGKFHKDKGAPVYDISLHEDYAGGYQLGWVTFADSARVKAGGWSGAASAECKVLIPGSGINSADGDFISRSLVAFVHDSIRADNIAALPREYVKKYLSDFRAEMEEMQKNTPAHELPSDYEDMLTMLPIYNDHGLLVIENSRYNYSGGAHPNMWSDVINMDVQNKKVLKLGDVMQVDSAAITKVLNEEARSTFHIGVKESLDSKLLVENVPATDNFIISDRGLIFYYNAYEITSYADGDARLFIPYKKLKTLLKNEFVARMELKL